MSIYTIVAITACAAGCLLLFYGMYALYNAYRAKKLLSYNSDAYQGPAGDPYWKGELPVKVDDYTVPRYVYEDLTESTEYTKDHGRIIGYRISPYLVIHSRVGYGVNPPVLAKYLRRFNGHLLQNDEITVLRKNWERISSLRKKADDTPLEADWFWAEVNGKIYAVHYEEDTMRDVYQYFDAWYPLVLKR